MKQKLIASSILVVLSWSSTVGAEVSPHVITFFIRPFPEIIISGTPAAQTAAQSSQKKAAPGKMLSSIVKKELHPQFPQAGIFVSYAGTLSTTDSDGQVIFERKTAGLKLQLLITEDIKPVPVDPLNSKTIYGFVLNPKAQAQLYLYERFLNPETELYEWNVSQIPTPKQKRIPYDTIIVFANPKHIIPPMGPTITMQSENLVLPDLFVTKHATSSTDALRFLKIRQYMAPVKFEYKYFKDEFQKKIRSS